MINEIYPPTKIYIKFIDTKKGWGVFCKEKILKGEIIEQCYGIVVHGETAPLKDYAFVLNQKNWQNNDAIIALGYGGIYNHSDEPNMVYIIIGKIIEFTATQDIEIGEEICHNYGKGYLETWKTKFI
jgi:SET domain-containing protein